MIGATLDQKYKLVRLLGEGGMGSVYEAEREGAPERVAVKVIHGSLLKPGSDGPQRFRREAQAASAIHSDHIVQVLDAGTDDATGLLYLVMEHLDGEDLQQLCDRLGPLAPEVALRIAAQALMGLSKAHERGIVHRDIKPANLFLARGRDGAITVKLLDFGIAKIKPDPLHLPPSTTLTTTGGFLGSPLYMSPEQVQSSRDVDPRTDIWSLGSALYCALAGRAPYQHLASVGQLLVAICVSPSPPLSQVAPWVPAEVGKAVHGALASKPEERYASAAAMLEALRRLLPSGLDLHEEMLAPVSARVRAAVTAPHVVVDPGATRPISGDETTAPVSPPQMEVSETLPSGRGVDPSPPSQTLERSFGVGDGRLVLTVGNIVEESTDAIVNVTDWLVPERGGADRAIHIVARPELFIHIAAGPGLFTAYQEALASVPGHQLEVGKALITPGFRLRAKHVIHCAGPMYKNDPVTASRLLASCYESALQICLERKLRSVAFPAISTGTFGYPMREAVSVAIFVTQRVLRAQSLPELVRFVFFDEEAFRVAVEVTEASL